MAAAIAAGLVFFLYLLTLAPSVAMWDTGEYMAAVKVLGLPHPPGNPFFMLLGHAFASLPLPLSYGGKTWRFETPRGVRTVQAKETDPTWTPPEWHYAEVATENGLKLRHLSRGQVVRVRDGTRLLVQGDEVGVILPGETEFVPLVLDEHVVFDNTLFIPPVGTKHRSIAGELGHYRLKLGDGYQLHGTPFTKSIGTSATHGCVRMHDEDIEWMYQNVPVGTKVYLY